MKDYNEIHHLQELALKEALETKSGSVILQAAQNRFNSRNSGTNAGDADGGSGFKM